MEWSAIAHNTNAADCPDKLNYAQSRLCRAFAALWGVTALQNAKQQIAQVHRAFAGANISCA